MYEIKEYDDSLDLDYFYDKCKAKGYSNNCSKSKLVKNLMTEKEFKLWILYYNNKPVGSTAFHSFDDVMGENSYRICVRTCVLTDELDIFNIRPLSTIIKKHQNISSQIYMPLCIRFTPKNSNLYITTCNKEKASMRLMHKIVFPELEKMCVVKNIKNIIYKGTEQTVWQLFPDLYLKSLEKYPRWKYKLIS